LRLTESDLFTAIAPDERFDLIVSNPPYIPSGELSMLQREVRSEPQAALDGGPDGLAVIRRLLRDSPDFLIERAYLVFEIGFDQNDDVQRLIDQTSWELREMRPDLQGIARTVVLRKRT